MVMVTGFFGTESNNHSLRSLHRSCTDLLLIGNSTFSAYFSAVPPNSPSFPFSLLLLRANIYPAPLPLYDILLLLLLLLYNYHAEESTSYTSNK